MYINYVFLQKEAPHSLLSLAGMFLSENHVFSEELKCFQCNTEGHLWHLVLRDLKCKNT